MISVPGWIILLLLVILMIWIWYKNPVPKDASLDNFDTPAEEPYNNVFGYENTPESREALEVAVERERLPNPPAQNAFIIGDLLEFNYNEHDAALMYYQDAVERLMEEPEDHHANHILDRIDDVVRELDITEARDKVREKQPKLKQVQIDKPVVKIKSDPQNVHDSNVNEDLKKIYNRIVINNMLEDNNDDNREELTQYLKNNLSPDRYDRAMKTLRYTNSYNSAVGEKENLVIDNVWKRINSKDNVDKRDALRESFADALIDCTDEKGYTVCSGGRCARILSSLTLLDSDKNIAEPVKTRDIIRSEVMSKAHKILQDSLEQIDDNIADEYLEGKDSPEVSEFESKVKEEIDKKIRIDYPHQPIHIIDGLIKDAQAGV